MLYLMVKTILVDQLYEEKRRSVVFVQSTLVISNSKGLSEILQDICSSTYQVCRIEEKII